MSVVLLSYHTFGAIQFLINEQNIGPVITLNNHSDRLTRLVIPLGEIWLSSSNSLQLRVLTGNQVGIDGFILQYLTN